MKKFIWQGGEGRFTKKAVDYMMLQQDDKELMYVESEWTGDQEECEEQFRVFWDCLAQLAEGKFDLNEFSVDFEHYGNPAEHFNTLKDVPTSLKKYLKKYYE